MAVYNLRWVKVAQYVEDPASEDVDIREGFDNARWQLISDDNNRVVYRYSCRAIYDVPTEDTWIVDAIPMDPDGKPYNLRDK